LKEKISTIKFEDFKSLLIPRLRDAHKGLFGHTLIIGGNNGMGGAVCLAGVAALRVGAGLVSVATKKEHISAIISQCPEIMAHAVTKAKNLNALLRKATVLIVGVGLGQTYWSKQLLKQVLRSSQPKIMDADAINLLAQQPSISDKWILTPHPGEAARLLHCSLQAIQANRIHAVQELQYKYGGVVVLKGSGSLVCTENSLSICKAGNPGMASGGMGDVLSGIIGGLLAQQFTLRQAAELGVYLHATAGDLVAMQKGERGMIASDLMDFLSKLVNP